jgi:hypothetical protein
MKQILTILAALLIVGWTISFWKVILGVALVAALVWGVYAVGVPSWRRRQGRALDRRNGETARRSGLAARAQIQHEQYLAGDDRGVYGNYRPTDL